MTAGGLSRQRSRQARRQPRDAAGRFADAAGESRTPGNAPAPVYERGGPTGRLRVVEYRGRTYSVPVDRHGRVPAECLAQHYYDYNAGGRAGHTRRPMTDSSKNAGRVYPRQASYGVPQIMPWFAHPNRSDVAGIDTAGTAGDPLALRDPKQRGRLQVVNATPKQEKEVKAGLRRQFSASELATIAAAERPYRVVVALPRERGASGVYRPAANIAAVGPQYLGGETLVHETVHALREDDRSRTGPVATGRARGRERKPLAPADRSLEEAATQAETVARVRPFSKKNSEPPFCGYYRSCATSAHPDISRFAAEDRRTVAGWSARPLRGKRMAAALESNFTETNISRYREPDSKVTAAQRAGQLKAGKGMGR